MQSYYGICMGSMSSRTSAKRADDLSMINISYMHVYDVFGKSCFWRNVVIQGLHYGSSWVWDQAYRPKTFSHFSLLSPLKNVRHRKCGKDKAPLAKVPLLIINLSLEVTQSVLQSLGRLNYTIVASINHCYGTSKIEWKMSAQSVMPSVARTGTLTPQTQSKLSWL
jgi:hypothetical protein